MAKPKTMIIYVAAANLTTVGASVAEARERGQAVRLISLSEFRGETEQNAGAVFVERVAGDELVYDKIQQAYPLIEVQDWTGSVDVDSHATFEAPKADETLKDLRLQLIGLGGSAPAGANAAQLADLIAAQKASNNIIPILPNPATQGTTIPDPTPVMLKADGDKLIDSNATGTNAAGLKAAEEKAGEPVTGNQTAGASATRPTTSAADAGSGDAPSAAQLVKSNSKDQLLSLAKDAGVTDVTADNNKDEIAAKIVSARTAS